MKYYLFFSYLLICISINAQNNVPITLLESDSIFSPKLTGESFFDNKEFIGDQYFNKDWVNCDILLTTGEMVYNKRIKYNGLIDEVILLNTSNYINYKLDKSFITDFWLKLEPGNPVHFKKIIVGDTTDVHLNHIFVQVKIEGKVSLYIQRRISIIGEENLYKKDNLYYFSRIGEMPLYFLKLPSNRYIKMSKIRRRPFLNLFPEQKKEIVKLMKDNHLNLKIESDCVKLIDLMNKDIL